VVLSSSRAHVQAYACL
jgi:hypothetical protein